MSKNASVNLWEIMTTMAGRDLPASEKCEKVVRMADTTGGFCSELSLTVDERGSWTVRLFCHEGSFNEIELAVNRNGGVTVKRLHETSVVDERRISF